MVLCYIIKTLELVYLTTVCILMWVSGMPLLSKFDFPNRVEGYFIILCCCISTFTVLYNNLLTNIRFKCKMSCVTLGKVTFDLVNYAILYCWLKNVCRDRFFKISSVIRWLCYTGIFAYTIYAVRSVKMNLRDTNPDVEHFLYGDAYTNFDVYCILYICVYPAFYVARVPIFLLYSMLTCCCDKGREYNDFEQF